MGARSVGRRVLRIVGAGNGQSVESHGEPKIMRGVNTGPENPPRWQMEAHNGRGCSIGELGVT